MTAFRSSWLAIVAAVMTILVVLTAIWIIALRHEVADLRDNNRSLLAEVDLLRQQANATAYHLAPTTDAPANSSGTAFLALDGSGVVTVSNLAPAPEGRSYQIWYFPTPDADPLPGATIELDGNGTGFTLIPADIGLFTDITITLEPAAGSVSPTGPIYLSGSTGGARG